MNEYNILLVLVCLLEMIVTYSEG